MFNKCVVIIKCYYPRFTLVYCLSLVPLTEKPQLMLSFLILWPIHSWCGKAGSVPCFASEVMSCHVTSPFSNLQLSNLWHNSPEPPAVVYSNSVLQSTPLFFLILKNTECLK